MLNILAIDTATEACSVALQTQEGAIVSRYDVCPQQHASVIFAMIDAVMSEANMPKAKLDCLAFAHGPGSFTGVRIATSVIQGLALGLDKPVAGVSTLQVLAQGVIQQLPQHQHDIAVAIDARMNEVYFARYQNVDGIATLIDTQQVLAPADAASLVQDDSVMAGTGWQAYEPLESFAPVVVNLPAAVNVLPIVSQMSYSSLVRSEHVTPEYIRNTVTWKKLPGR